MIVQRGRRGFKALGSAILLLAAACGGGDGGGEPLSYDDAMRELSKLVADVEPLNDPVTGGQLVPGGRGDLGDLLPPITDFPMVVEAPQAGNEVSAEIFVSTEKSGTGSDGWFVEMAHAFNEADVRLADGRAAAVDVRKIASGIGYEFIAAQKNVPDAFSPSNQLWIEMAEAAGTKMTAVKQSVVDNVAGIVMKSEIAERVGGATGKPDAAAVIEAVVDGQVKLAYTNPYASSTGLNFLITILATFANGDEDRMLDPDVASAFEQFQKNVPFTALTTLQLRDAIEEGGSIDAFIMEYQTFVNTEDLRSGFEFVPFGVVHDNPLYAVGDAAPDKLEVLTLLASFAAGDRYRDLAREYGFDPPFEYKSSFEVPSGSTLIEAQKLWKERKDAGRPVSAVFVIDVSGSMEGSRMQALRKALVAGSEFISEDSAIGMVLFNDRVRTVLEIEDFDVDHQARFAEAVRAMDPGGGTAMYDGIAVGLDVLVKAQAKSPDVKPLLFVLTDGETNAGHKFDQTSRIIEGLRIPVYTVGFEANVDELARVSSLVEAASLNAGQQNVAFEIGSFFNAQL